MQSVLLADPPPCLPMYLHGSFPRDTPSLSLFSPNTALFFTTKMLSTEIVPEPTIFIDRGLPFAFHTVCLLPNRGDWDLSVPASDGMKMVGNTQAGPRVTLRSRILRPTEVLNHVAILLY